MPYCELDKQFFDSIVQRMRLVGDFDDMDIAAAFNHYTKTMIDLAMIHDDVFKYPSKYDPKLIEMVNLYAPRLANMRRTGLFQKQLVLKAIMELDIKNTRLGEISYYNAMVVPLRKLSLACEMGNVEIYEHLDKINAYL